MKNVLTMTKNRKNSNKDNEYEKCVCCGKMTDVLCSAHIDLRDNYIVGAGQLCSSCYNELYSVIDNKP